MKKIVKWHRLKNRYWLKIMFVKVDTYTSLTNYLTPNAWLLDIIVAKTKRKANDHYCKSRRSPKSLYRKSTNVRGGIESLLITLEALKEFENFLVVDSTIIIQGTDKKRYKAYSRLLKYGYSIVSWSDSNMPDYIKEIKKQKTSVSCNERL